MNYKRKCLKPYYYKTLKECFYTVTEKYPDVIAYRQIKDKKEEETVTYSKFKENVIDLGAQLLKLGLAGKKAAIIGENSIQWMTAYFSVVCGGMVAVPLDKELDLKTLTYQINFCDAEAVFVSGKCAHKVAQIYKNCENVKHFIVMRSEFASDVPEDFLDMNTLIKLGETLAESDKQKFVDAKVEPEDLCDIIFTSGTTGANKGVMLSQKNICASIYAAMTHIEFGVKSFACLPINHSYEKNCNLLCTFSMGRTSCINDDLMHLTQNILRYDPTIAVMVPMILETIERRIKVETKKVNLEKHTNYGIMVSNIFRKFGIDHRERFFAPILKNFGKNLRQIIVGGAPLKEETRKFFESIGITVVNGYGISECAPLVASNLSLYQRAGSVGHVVPTCKVKIVEPNENGDGVIYVKGDNVMMGYYKDPESTSKVMYEDGWFDTGDIGHLDKDGFLYISGRVKNLIILSNGKNIYPEEIEEMICDAVPYIKEIVVYTDEKGLGLYASAFLDPDYIADNGITDPYKKVMEDIHIFNKTVPSFKRISNVSLVDKEFAKTTTQKIQRFKVEKVVAKEKVTVGKGE
ncbi:MAG: AMP-binding protein [Clostridia bacterium]|nr:AMP-binding protein [Clostridia bacterium]